MEDTKEEEEASSRAAEATEEVKAATKVEVVTNREVTEEANTKSVVYPSVVQNVLTFQQAAHATSASSMNRFNFIHRNEPFPLGSL